MLILILENQRSYAETVKEYLETCGHTIVFVNTTNMSVDNALAEAAKHQPNRVLVDCRWNDTDSHDRRGVSFVRRWRGKAVLMSGDTVEGYDGPFVSKRAGLAAIEKALQ